MKTKKGVNTPEPTNVHIDGCDNTANCQLKKKTTVNISFNFVPSN